MDSRKFLFASIGVLLLALAVSLFNTVAIQAARPAPSTAPQRGYYLTTTTHTGSQALFACAAGYHMASLMELHEPSVLRYETALGETADDAGAGPPIFNVYGWIRTGWRSDGRAIPGESNCLAWTSDSSEQSGTVAWVSYQTSSQSGPWVLSTAHCDGLAMPRVWCVQD